MRRIGVVFIFFCILLISCDKNDDNDNISKKVNQKKLLELVNNYRKKGCNCGGQYMSPTEPVVWNDLLEFAAQKHSNDMDKNNFFSHTSSNGKNPGDRISEAGYKWKTYGENIAKGRKTENDAITGWMNSADHCKNIMNPNFREMGVAASGNYWTQIFGKR